MRSYRLHGLLLDGHLLGPEAWIEPACHGPERLSRIYESPTKISECPQTRPFEPWSSLGFCLA